MPHKAAGISMQWQNKIVIRYVLVECRQAASANAHTWNRHTLRWHTSCITGTGKYASHAIYSEQPTILSEVKAVGTMCRG